MDSSATGIKITFSVNLADMGAVGSALVTAPHGVKLYAAKDFKKSYRYIVRFRNIQQIEGFFKEVQKHCKGKYVWMKKHKKENLQRGFTEKKIKAAANSGHKKHLQA